MPGESAHMKLIDDQVLHRDLGIGAVAPVKIIGDDTGLVVAVHERTFAPLALAGHCFGIRVNQETGRIKQKAAAGVISAIDTEGIFEFLNIEAKDDHGVDIADAVIIRIRNNSKGLALLAVKKDQGNGGRILRVNGEADPARQDDRPISRKSPGGLRNQPLHRVD